MNLLDLYKKSFQGEIYDQSSYRYIYATDASEYREIPIGVVYPKVNEDIKLLIQFALENKISLIPRAGGTSLAGQVVGNGLVVDISKYFNHIIEINESEQFAWVEPGVVRDILNQHLSQKGLFFAPETSTSNRACIGGMFGNNSCGANALVYGTTREHILEVKGYLSDGSDFYFKNIENFPHFIRNLNKDSFEYKIYDSLWAILSDSQNQQEIKNHFPEKQIIRRNCGYAIDELIYSDLFSTQDDQTNKSEHPFNLCKLLAGSEGTLAFVTAIKVKLSPLPSIHKAVIAVHTHSITETLKGNIIALKLKPSAVELIDNQILKLSLENRSQAKNIDFLDVENHKETITLLAIEFTEGSEDELLAKCSQCIQLLKMEGIGFHFPILKGSNLNNVWNLRKAGLGIMSNLKGDAKARSFVEDSVVLPKDLPSYFAEFDQICKENKVDVIYYGHISTGEIHKKPILNLQKVEEYQLFSFIAQWDAQLVKKYKGSISGEHGDGRLRGAFIPFMLGNKNYELLISIKNLFDPNHIFNVGKITNTPPIDQNLRVNPFSIHISNQSYFDFPETDGFENAVNKCCNSGDCRKSHLFSGAMCPSFQATNDEYFSTRARANLLREYLQTPSKLNQFFDKKRSNTSGNTSLYLEYNEEEIYKILSWCLACKACKAECPSQVDMTKLKAEFLQHYYDKHGIPLRSRIIGNYPIINELGSYFSSIYNWTVTNKKASNLMKKVIGFAPKRSLPTIHKQSLYSWIKKRGDQKPNTLKKLYLFCDEFTNRNDTEIGKKGILLLEALGFEVLIIKSAFSGRTYLSKGMLKSARKCAEKNVKLFSPLISDETPLIGIEPSAILSFRDEYPDLLNGNLKSKAIHLSKNTYLIDEFIALLMEKGDIDRTKFSREQKHILFHAHCYQKAISDKSASIRMMQIPINYRVTLIEDGCCGMAGSFGFEKEHFEMSQKIGELILFPTIRAYQNESMIAACGTSCRHQIKDGTKVDSCHPLEILFDALL